MPVEDVLHLDVFCDFVFLTALPKDVQLRYSYYLVNLVLIFCICEVHGFFLNNFTANPYTVFICYY